MKYKISNDTKLPILSNLATFTDTITIMMAKFGIIITLGYFLKPILDQNYIIYNKINQ